MLWNIFFPTLIFFPPRKKLQKKLHPCRNGAVFYDFVLNLLDEKPHYIWKKYNQTNNDRSHH